MPEKNIYAEGEDGRWQWQKDAAEEGEGSILERADGRSQTQIDLGRSIDGRRQRKYASTATQSEAVDTLRRLGGRAVDGQLLGTSYSHLMKQTAARAARHMDALFGSV